MQYRRTVFNCMNFKEGHEHIRRVTDKEIFESLPFVNKKDDYKSAKDFWEKITINRDTNVAECPKYVKMSSLFFRTVLEGIICRKKKLEVLNILFWSPKLSFVVKAILFVFSYLS